MYSFGDIIGQEGIVRHLRNALQTGSISHAYILNGETGTGRRTIAHTFAAALQCQGSGEKPCGTCLSCIQVQSGSQPDILTVVKDKEKSLGVDTIRKLRTDIRIRPYSSQYKVYIVEDAELMTVQAQNALLKVLEEPPSYGVIILIADGLTNFLPTILSRCVTLQVKPLGEKETAEALGIRAGIDEEKARILARSAGGNLGRALQTAGDEAYLMLRDQCAQFLRKLRSRSAEEIRAFAAETDPQQREEIFRFIQMWYRDILLYKSTSGFDQESCENLIFADQVQYIKENAERISYGSLSDILTEQENAARRRKANVNPEAALQVMLLRIREAERRR